MKTITHSVLFAHGMLTTINGGKKSQLYTQMKKNLPFVLLPDAIRAYIGARQASHCEEAMNGDVSWMEFPMPDVLKALTKENAAEKICHYVSDQIPKKGDGKDCAIGEYTNFRTFNLHNVGHPNYMALAMHLMQDNVLDEYLRKELVDVTERCEDKYTIKHSGEVIDGATLRKQISLFEDALFMVGAGKIYQATGTVVNRAWFDDVVYDALLKAYPQDLAERTYSYMKFSDDVNDRIIACNFELTDEEKAAIIICEDVELACTELIVGGFWATKEALK